jgi:NAD(P)-dependent dehydrogenase (short-subunit alcohol dehydrogenase family)
MCSAPAPRCGRRRGALDVEARRVEPVLTFNLTGAWLSMRAVLPLMLRRRRWRSSARRESGRAQASRAAARTRAGR